MCLNKSQTTKNNKLQQKIYQLKLNSQLKNQNKIILIHLLKKFKWNKVKKIIKF